MSRSTLVSTSIASTLASGETSEQVYAVHFAKERTAFHHDAIMDTDPMGLEWQAVHASRTGIGETSDFVYASYLQVDSKPTYDARDVYSDDECPSTVRSNAA